MVIQRFFLSMALLTGTFIGFGQDEDHVSEGLFKASATFSYGFMNDDVQNNYVSGLIEYHVDDKISLRGDGAYFIGHQSEFAPLKLNHQVFAGVSYHFETGSPKLDPYLGLSPGVAYSQRDDQVLGPDSLVISEPSFNPVLAFTGGVNYYSGKFFHFFLEARFIRGRHLSNSTPKYLDEFRLTFGLGWDLHFK